MSRNGPRKQPYYCLPTQTMYSTLPSIAGYPSYQDYFNYPQYYCYPVQQYGFYDGSYVAPGVVVASSPADEVWVADDENAAEEPPAVVKPVSRFSADAPEFVSRRSEVQELAAPEVVRAKKKKRKKKKKTQQHEVALQHESVPCQDNSGKKCDEAEPPAKVVTKKKAVRFHDKEDSSDDKVALNKSEAGVEPAAVAVGPRVLDYSKLFKNQPAKKVGDWPQLATEKAQSVQDKPFLDWRDQRTGAVKKVQPVTAPITDPQADEVDWVQVTRKAKKKPVDPGETPESTRVPVEVEKPVQKSTVDQEKRQKKKLREKEKKRRLRDEKLLAAKLAPKGQKISIITPQIMNSYLRASNNNNTKTNSLPDRQIDTEFPALRPIAARNQVSSRRCVSDSESEWETTEVLTSTTADSAGKTPPSAAPLAAAPTKNVKRKHKILLEMSSLLAKPVMRKKVGEPSKTRRATTAGFVANVLDRSAPVLSRGKIRSKKRKLSDIRKALLAAKAKRKARLEENSSSATSSVAQDSSATTVVVAAAVAATPVEQPLEKHRLHTKKFREYCDQMLTDEIDALAKDMLFHLRMFQDRAFKKDPIKGRMRKRLIAGLREVTKQVERHRVRVIFLAPDIQRCPETGGLDEAVHHLLESARKSDVAIVYALSRRKIGRILMKNVAVSCCGVLNYQGTEETWKLLDQLVAHAKAQYQAKARIVKIEAHHDDEPQQQQPDQKMAAPETDALFKLIKLSLTDSPSQV